MVYDIQGNVIYPVYTLDGTEQGYAYDINGEAVYVDGAEAYPTFSVMGDSISTFEGYIPEGNKTWYPKEADYNDVQSVEETWWKMFETEFGSALDTNQSYSGSPISYDGWGQGVDSSANAISFIGRSGDIGNPDLLLIFGATNDSSIINGYGGAVGEYKYADWVESDLTAFRPALAYLLNKLITEHPNAQIVFMRGSWLNSDVYNSIETICNYYNVPFVTLTNIDMEGGHPNKAGMVKIKKQLIAFMVNNGLI